MRGSSKLGFLCQFPWQTQSIPRIVVPIFGIVPAPGPEQFADAGLSQVAFFGPQFMRADLGDVYTQILQDLPGRAGQTLSFVEHFALIDATWLACPRRALQFAQTFGWHEFGGSSEREMKDVFCGGAAVLERNLAVAFGIELAQIALIQVPPGIVAVQEGGAVIVNTQQIHWRDTQVGQATQGQRLARFPGPLYQPEQVCLDIVADLGLAQCTLCVGNQLEILTGDVPHQVTNPVLINDVAVGAERRPDIRITQTL